MQTNALARHLMRRLETLRLSCCPSSRQEGKLIPLFSFEHWEWNWLYLNSVFFSFHLTQSNDNINITRKLMATNSRCNPMHQCEPTKCLFYLFRGSFEGIKFLLKSSNLILATTPLPNVYLLAARVLTFFRWPERPSGPPERFQP